MKKMNNSFLTLMLVFVMMFIMGCKSNLVVEESLAKFLKSEGGTHEEKTRIAQILCWRKGNSEYPDTIQEILKFNDCAVINPDFWNTFAEPTDEDFEIAKTALKSTEKPEYIHYFFREFYEEEFEKNEPDVVTYKTENYVFYN